MNTIIFDMDGVIFDTEQLWLNCWKELSNIHNIPDIEVNFRKCIGVTIGRIREIMIEAYGEDFQYEQFSQEGEKIFKEIVASQGMPIKPGVRELLTFLRENNYKIGLASSTRKAVVLKELKMSGLDSCFDLIVGGDELKRSKPEPDIYLKACELIGTRPEEAYAVEDSYNGIRSAHSAGMKAIMVPDMIEPDEEMKEKAFMICTSLFDVINYLNTLPS